MHFGFSSYYLLLLLPVFMSCKENFSMFDDFSQHLTPLPLPDEMKEIMKEQAEGQTDQINFDVLLNKFVNNLEITDIQLQQLSEHQRMVLEHMKKKTQKKTKRPDECQKLFYKRGFKFVQKQFFKKKKCKSRKMSQFYHHYFDRVSKTENIPITSFYHPDKKTKPGLQLGFKTFNITYIRLLLKSSTFRQALKLYYKFFLDECLKERKKKLHSFSTSIKRIMNRTNDDPKLLIEYLQSGQCKIPWTLDEIKQAQQIAFEELTKAEANDPDHGIGDVQRQELENEDYFSMSSENEESEELLVKLMRRD